MRKNKIISKILIAVSVIFTTVAVSSIITFTAKADSTATATPISKGGANISINQIPVGDQTFTLGDNVQVVFPKDFLTTTVINDKSGMKNLNFSYHSYPMDSVATNKVNQNGYKALRDEYLFSLFAQYNNGSLDFISEYNKPITITIHLSDEQLSGVDKSKLKVLNVDATDSYDPFQVIPTTVSGNDVTFTTSYSSDSSSFKIAELQDSTATTSPSVTSSITATATTTNTNGVKTGDANNIFEIVSFTVGAIVVGTTVILQIYRRKANN